MMSGGRPSARLAAKVPVVLRILAGAESHVGSDRRPLQPLGGLYTVVAGGQKSVAVLVLEDDDGLGGVEIPHVTLDARLVEPVALGLDGRRVERGQLDHRHRAILVPPRPGKIVVERGLMAESPMDTNLLFRLWAEIVRGVGAEDSLVPPSPEVERKRATMVAQRDAIIAAGQTPEVPSEMTWGEP